MDTPNPIPGAKLARQSYGIATAGKTFGGPRGIWLECTGCDENQVIVGSGDPARWAAVPTEAAAEVFRRNGWTGDGPLLKRAKCPACSVKAVAAARSAKHEVINPVLALPSAQRLMALGPDARALIADILGELAQDARQRADKCWRSHKAPMAAYWKAVSVYAGHFRRVLRSGGV